MRLGKLLTLAHRVVVHQAHVERGLAALGATRPHGEAVGLALAHGDAEEALVLEAGELVAVARIAQAHVVRIAVEGAVVPHLEVAVGTPAHQPLRELERTVLHHLGVEAAVGGIVDVLEEDAVHGGLHGCAQPRGVHVEGAPLGLGHGGDGEHGGSGHTGQAAGE